MFKITWEKFYEKFDNLSLAKKKSHVKRLSSFGDAYEVYMVASDLAYEDVSFANQFIEKAHYSGVRFEPSDVYYFADLIDKSLLEKLALNTSEAFSSDDINEIKEYLSSATIKQIATRAGLNYEDYLHDKYLLEESKSVVKKSGIFSKVISWDDFYLRYKNFSYYAQKTHALGLSSYGPFNEFMELVRYFASRDIYFAGSFIKTAMKKGVAFKSEQIREFAGLVDYSSLKKIAFFYPFIYNMDDLDYLSNYLKPSDIRKLARKSDVKKYIVPRKDYTRQKVPKMGCLGFLLGMSALQGMSNTGSKKKKLPRPCNERPPHYGYRYGRWYFGNDHAWGCEPDDGSDLDYSRN